VPAKTRRWLLCVAIALPVWFVAFWPVVVGAAWHVLYGDSIIPRVEGAGAPWLLWDRGQLMLVRSEARFNSRSEPGVRITFGYYSSGGLPFVCSTRCEKFRGR
jgi:hypothetical protein